MCVNFAECMFMREATRHNFFMIGSVDIKIYLLLFIDAALAAFCIPEHAAYNTMRRLFTFVHEYNI